MEPSVGNYRGMKLKQSTSVVVQREVRAISSVGIVRSSHTHKFVVADTCVTSQHPSWLQGLSPNAVSATVPNRFIGHDVSPELLQHSSAYIID